MKKLTLVLLALSILSLIGQLLVLPYLPDTVPTHWNAAGEIDGYGSKYTNLFLAALPLLMLGLFALTPRIDPRKESYEKHRKAYDIFRVFMTLFFIALTWVINAAAMGWPVDVGRIISIALGVMFLVLGNYMPQILSNYTFGIKTPWTLESPYVWRKTHAAGGVLFCICGIVMIAAGIITTKWMATLSIALMIISVIGLYLYSWLLFRKESKKA